MYKFRVNLTLNEGTVEGKSFPEGNEGYESYKGIPYAKSPEGPLRWKPPVPVGKFDFVDGTKIATVCHTDLEGVDMSNDDYKGHVENGRIGENWNGVYQK